MRLWWAVRAVSIGEQVQLWASCGGLRCTFRVGFNPQTLDHEQHKGGALSAHLTWNASAPALADALTSVVAGPNVRVARELYLHAMSEVSHANSRVSRARGLGRRLQRYSVGDIRGSGV